MAGYAKVFSSIRKSSLWGADHKVIRVWIYMLTECDSDGVVEGAVPGIAHDCHLSPEELREVLDLLMAPDPDSRTPDNEGRRLAVVPGGWKVLNYHIYRERGQGKEGSRAPYMRLYRSKKEAPSGGHALPESVTRNTNANAGTDVHPTGVSPAAPPAPGKPKVDLEPQRQEVLKHWQLVAVPAGLPGVLKVGDRLRKAMDARLKDPAWLGLFREAVDYAARHPAGAWMRGQGDRSWKVSLEWLLKPDKAEETAAKARAEPGRSRGIGADTSTQAQVQQVPTRKLAPLPSPAGAP